MVSLQNISLRVQSSPCGVHVDSTWNPWEKIKTSTFTKLMIDLYNIDASITSITLFHIQYSRLLVKVY